MKLPLIWFTLVAAALPAAEIASVAHPQEKLPDGKTVIWTPLFQATWDKLNETHGGKPMKVEPPNELISRLDSFTWKMDSVMPEEGWKTWAGPATDEFLATVNAEAAKMLGDEEAPFRLQDRREGTVAAFGLLNREVKFREPFFRSQKVPMTFSAGNVETKVKFFGVKGQLSNSYGTDVRILIHAPAEKTHALQIICKDSNDTAILFRPPAGSAMDFATACEQIRTSRKAWADDSKLNLGPNDPWLHARDEIQVPYLKLESTHDFASDLASNRFYKDQPHPRLISRAEQEVKFELHEGGARVRAKVSAADPFGGEPPEKTTHPRSFLYNAPFFVFLWRDGAEWPYFGSWVGDASSMEPFN